MALGWKNKLCMTIAVIFSSHMSLAQPSYVLKVFFLYGSKPAPGYEKIESPAFGGIHGGHVSIGVDTLNVSFHHVNGYHIFPKKSHLMGTYEQTRLSDFLKDTSTYKYTVFEIPLDSIQHSRLENTISAYLQSTPYDYAFLGMRCASATYDMLSHAGFFKFHSRFGMMCSNFYPRLLRKKLFRLAKEKHYQVRFQSGRKSRVWEND